MQRSLGAHAEDCLTKHAAVQLLPAFVDNLITQDQVRSSFGHLFHRPKRLVHYLSTNHVHSLDRLFILPIIAAVQSARVFGAARDARPQPPVRPVQTIGHQSVPSARSVGRSVVCAFQVVHDATCLRALKYAFVFTFDGSKSSIIIGNSREPLMHPLTSHVI